MNARNEDGSNVVRLDRANERMRGAFLRWQCRIRQIAMRSHEGRPTSGMAPIASPVPEVPPDSGPAPSPAQDAGPGIRPPTRIVTVLCKRPEHSATMELRHMARRTHDPAERREAALTFFAERYYQAAREFSDVLTASFPPDSRIAAMLLSDRECRLGFEQFSQRYDVRCTVQRLSPNNPLREATFWHNLLFNPRQSADCTILGFAPDWPASQADPPPG